jgi:isoamylase
MMATRRPVLAAARAVWRGEPRPLGATWDGLGVNFAVYSRNATRVELCLFDARGRREIERVDLRDRTDFVWHCYLPEARPGQLYGYRVHGPYEPEQGHRFNPNKLLIDPYAHWLVGQVRWTEAHFGYRIGSRRLDLSFDGRDNAAGIPKCEVVDGAFTWGDDRAPRVPWEETIIYEMHVKGFSKLNPLVPPQLRGTYSGLATPAVVDHLKRLGVTAIELLPVHAFIDDKLLIERGLRNYWGYNSIGFFAPDSRYSATGTIGGFKSMVRSLHTAGIEVILDVVFNHTGEGNQLGPTLSFRGLDNASYYKLSPENPRYYVDYTGTGNTFDLEHPAALQLVMDSLRYWIEEMHVDGFRFDLATALARTGGHYNPFSSFFNVIRQDPVISRAKLIAEPWDVGDGGYQVGGFPPGWSEWNGRYRDTVRSFWRGDDGTIGELASRLSGSSDLYNGRGPSASINFVTAHDGFTLNDLVSYDDKHNDANGEGNRDGEQHNRSWNCGVEGPTDDPAVIELRKRQRRNLLATLLLSQGVPMLVAGDEFGRTQRGNNNGYCQDNELGWIDWDLSPADEELLEFVARTIAVRKRHPLFRRRTFFTGKNPHEPHRKDIVWLAPAGNEMTEANWADPFARCLGVLLSGVALAENDAQGQPILDEDLLLLLNAHHEDVEFRMPAHNGYWVPTIDTAHELGKPPADSRHDGGTVFPLRARSLVLFCPGRRP